MASREGELGGEESESKEEGRASESFKDSVED